MMYPLVTLEDGTEIVRSELLSDGTVKVYVEKPDEIEGFRHATCCFPEYRWEDVYGFDADELKAYRRVIESESHRIGSLHSNKPELAKPLFLDGMFNRRRKCRYVKFVESVNGENESYDLYVIRRKYGAQPHLHVLINGWLIPLGMTSCKLRHTALQNAVVSELYGSPANRRKLFLRFREENSEFDAEQLIRTQLNKESELKKTLTPESKYIAEYIKGLLEAHIRAYRACKDGSGSFPDFIGAALVGELDSCIRLSDEMSKIKDGEIK